MKRNYSLHVSLSHNFPLRNRCKHCGSNKLAWYTFSFSGLNLKYKKPIHMMPSRYANHDYIFGIINRNKKKFYAIPRSFSFNPKLMNGNRHFRASDHMYIIECDNCGKQEWAYLFHSNMKLPENINRKARIFGQQIINSTAMKFW